MTKVSKLESFAQTRFPSYTSQFQFHGLPAQIGLSVGAKDAKQVDTNFFELTQASLVPFFDWPCIFESQHLYRLWTDTQ